MKEQRSGHLFLLCGPPGSGKTSLMRMAKDDLPLELVKRITTRGPRVEENDGERESVEYKFVPAERFVNMLAAGSATNFVEWNRKLYATDLAALEGHLSAGRDCLLLEDMPSAVHLKRTFGSQVTVILVFTDDKSAFLSLDFSKIAGNESPCVKEWKRRLRKKYDDQPEREKEKASRDSYLQEKMARAVPDLAFMAGRLRAGEDIRVLPNRKDKAKDAYRLLEQLVSDVRADRLFPEIPGKSAFVIMPFSQSFNKIYRFVIQPVVEREGINCKRGDEVATRLNVVEDVRAHIEASDLIIADISGGNPNVFLELGISIQLGKAKILISQDEENPFDIANERSIRYEDTAVGWDGLRDELAKIVRAVRFERYETSASR